LAPEAEGHGVPEVIEAVMLGGGRIRRRVAAVKSLASALTIGTGGSVGREGPIVQIGAAVGSALGQALRLPAAQLRTLAACGTAAGIAACAEEDLNRLRTHLTRVILKGENRQETSEWGA
jgi:CIC family chloride channel protein